MKASLREEVETQVREEMKARYENDRSHILEAMNTMLSDVAAKVKSEHQEAINSLNEERTRLTNAIKEARASYNEKLQARIGVLEQFVVNKLKEELEEFFEDRKEVDALRVKLVNEVASAKQEVLNKNEKALAELAETASNLLQARVDELNEKKAEYETKIEESELQLETRKKELSEEVSNRINVLESFVTDRLKKELVEFEADKKALAETRVRLLSESKRKMEETKRDFLARASKLVESTVQNQLRSELTQLKEDIMEARQNMLGMRIFETFKAEFMTGYLSEKTEIKKLMTKLEETNSALKLVESKISEKDQTIEALNRRVKLAETNVNRVKTMNELLAPLSKESRVVMEELLGTVKTEKLHEAFKRYLPSVLNGTQVNAQGRRTLSETAHEIKKTPVVSKEVTGDRKQKLAETAQPSNNDEIQKLARLAGIKN